MSGPRDSWTSTLTGRFPWLALLLGQLRLPISGLGRQVADSSSLPGPARRTHPCRRAFPGRLQAAGSRRRAAEDTPSPGMQIAGGTSANSPRLVNQGQQLQEDRKPRGRWGTVVISCSGRVHVQTRPKEPERALASEDRG